MGKKLFFTLIFLTFAIELVLGITLVGRIGTVHQDTVLINECKYSVVDDFGEEEKYSDKLEYSVLDMDGNLLYKNSDNVSLSINEAIKHGDTCLDLEKDGKVIARMIVGNKTADEINRYKNVLIISILSISAMQLLMVIFFYLYLRKNIVRPFEKMNAFASRVAQGNLDTPLELDKKHIFGSFTESFDLMRSELKKARAAEKKANDEKKEMIAKLSHDIKTPVASIKSTSELGYELATSEKLKEKFNQINIKSDQVTALVSNLFNSSINDITAIEVKPLVQPSSIVADLIKNADFRGKAGNFDIPKCRVYIDRLRLLQAFDNIFMNSYKYGGTDINVNAVTDEGCLVIEISDCGPGVSAEELPLLKEKYKRGSNSSGKDGAGLGLFLTNYYIENMNGKLELYDSSPGFGVRIYLRIAE